MLYGRVCIRIFLSYFIRLTKSDILFTCFDLYYAIWLIMKCGKDLKVALQDIKRQAGIIYFKNESETMTSGNEWTHTLHKGWIIYLFTEKRNCDVVPVTTVKLMVRLNWIYFIGLDSSPIALIIVSLLNIQCILDYLPYKYQIFPCGVWVQ